MTVCDICRNGGAHKFESKWQDRKSRCELCEDCALNLMDMVLPIFEAYDTDDSVASFQRIDKTKHVLKVGHS